MRRGVKNPESVAEHSYRMAMLALLYAPGVKKAELCTQEELEQLSLSESNKTSKNTTSKNTTSKNKNVNDDEIDVLHCCQMALVHDLAEAIVGDIVVDGEAKTRDNISKAEKQKLEMEAIELILGASKKS